MKLSEMNPNADMNELFFAAPDRVVAEVVNAFKECLAFYNQPIKEETLRAYAKRALTYRMQFKAILGAIKRMPDFYDRFPSFNQFSDLVRIETQPIESTPKEQKPRWIDEFKPEIDIFIEKYGEDTFDRMGPAYLINAQGYSQKDISFLKDSLGSEMLYMASALALYEWNIFGRTGDLPRFWEKCKASIENAQEASRLELKKEIRKITENYVRVK